MDLTTGVLKRRAPENLERAKCSGNELNHRVKELASRILKIYLIVIFDFRLKKGAFEAMGDQDS